MRAKTLGKYFTLSQMDELKGGMKKMLDACMDKLANCSKKEGDLLEAEYMRAFDTARQIFGEAVFRLPRDGRLVGKHSVPLSDAVLVALGKFSNSADRLVAQKELISLELERLLNNPESYETLVGRANTRAATKRRIELVEDIYSKALIT